MDQLNNSSIDLSIEAERKLARTFMGRIEWEMILIGVLQFTTWIATWVLVIQGIIPLLVGFLIALFTACNAYFLHMQDSMVTCPEVERIYSG